MPRRGQSGFTLIELLMVVTVIAIVAAIAIPGLLRARESGDEASAIGSMRAINSAQHAFSQSCAGGMYASVLSDLSIPPNLGGMPFISPDLGAGAPSVIKSGFTVEMNRGGDATIGTVDACNGVDGSDLGSSYYAFADPVVAGQGRHFWINAAGTIYVNTASMSGETAGFRAPGSGTALQ